MIKSFSMRENMIDAAVKQIYEEKWHDEELRCVMYFGDFPAELSPQPISKRIAAIGEATGMPFSRIAIEEYRPNKESDTYVDHVDGVTIVCLEGIAFFVANANGQSRPVVFKKNEFVRLSSEVTRAITRRVPKTKYVKYEGEMVTCHTFIVAVIS